MEISICITTFKRRLPQLKKLIGDIRGVYPDIEILVGINGEYSGYVEEDYRTDVLTHIASVKNVIPIMFTEFRSLSKIWNTLVIHSRTNYNLILNDDLVFSNPNIMQEIADYVNQTNNEIFRLNGGWSHFVVTKTKLDELGYFDERLLTIGEEDGDMTWRYMTKHGCDVPILNVGGIANLANDYNIPPENMSIFKDNKPKFNRTFIMTKYKEDGSGTQGMFDFKCKDVLGNEKQYPYEMFWFRNKKNIGDGENIEL